MKTITTVYIDSEVLLELKSRGLKISNVVNNLLKSHLDIVKEEDDVEKEYSDDINKTEVEMARLMGQLGELRKTKNRIREQMTRRKQEVREKEEKGWEEIK